MLALLYSLFSNTRLELVRIGMDAGAALLVLLKPRSRDFPGEGCGVVTEVSGVAVDVAVAAGAGADAGAGAVAAGAGAAAVVAVGVLSTSAVLLVLTSIVAGMTEVVVAVVVAVVCCIADERRGGGVAGVCGVVGVMSSMKRLINCCVSAMSLRLLLCLTFLSLLLLLPPPLSAPPPLLRPRLVLRSPALSSPPPRVTAASDVDDALAPAPAPSPERGEVAWEDARLAAIRAGDIAFSPAIARAVLCRAAAAAAAVVKKLLLLLLRLLRARAQVLLAGNPPTAVTFGPRIAGGARARQSCRDARLLALRLLFVMLRETPGRGRFVRWAAGADDSLEVVRKSVLMCSSPVGISGAGSRSISSRRQGAKGCASRGKRGVVGIGRTGGSDYNTGSIQAVWSNKDRGGSGYR